MEGPQHHHRSSLPLLSHLIICCVSVCLQLFAPLFRPSAPATCVHDDEDDDGDGAMMLGRWQLESECFFAFMKHAQAALGGGSPVSTSCTKLLSLACFTLTWCRARTFPRQQLRCDQVAASPAVCLLRLRTIVRIARVSLAVSRSPAMVALNSRSTMMRRAASASARLRNGSCSSSLPCGLQLSAALQPDHNEPMIQM